MVTLSSNSSSLFLQVCDKAKAEGKLEDLMIHLEGKWGRCSIKTERQMGCNIIVTFAPIWILISESIEIIKVIGNSIHSTTLKPKLMEWSEKIDLMETSLDRWISLVDRSCSAKVGDNPELVARSGTCRHHQ